MKNPDILTELFKDAYRAKGKRIEGRSRNIVLAIGVHDPISAVVAATVGHKIYPDILKTPYALQISGFGIAGTYLLPDTGEIGSEKLADATILITKRVLERFPNTLIMADLDHGYGDARKSVELVESVIPSGIAGFNFEDQDPKFFKSCGHVGTHRVSQEGHIGGGKVVIPRSEMVEKLEAVSLARDLFVEWYGHVAINARTDIFSTYDLSSRESKTKAIKDAIDRGNAYLRSGADIIFYEAVPDMETVKILIGETCGPVSINALRGGRTKPQLCSDELDRMGVARMSVPISSVEAYVWMMTDVYAKIFAKGTNKGIPTVGFDAVKDFLGWPESLAVLGAREIDKYGGLIQLQTLIDSIEGAYSKYVSEKLRMLNK